VPILGTPPLNLYQWRVKNTTPPVCGAKVDPDEKYPWCEFFCPVLAMLFFASIWQGFVSINYQKASSG
jgi:hypothetical protein